jgi:hypothetical protein
MQLYLSTNDIFSEKENQYIADIFYSLTTNIHEQEPLYGIEKNIDKKRKRAKSVENYIDALIKNVVYLKKCCEEFWNIVEIIFAEESIANAALIELQIADIKESIKNECNNNPKILINYKEEFEQSARRNNCITISSQLEELEFQYCFFFCQHILTLDFIDYLLYTNLFIDYLKNYYSRKPFNVYRDIFKAYTYQYSGVISGQWKYVSSVEIDDKDNGEKNLALLI